MPYETAKTIIRTFGLGKGEAKEFPERKKLKTLSEDEWEDLKKKRKKGAQPHGRWQMKNREFEELEESSR